MPRYIDADAFFNDFPELRDYEYASQDYEVDAVPVRPGHWVHGREISRSYIGDACVGIQYQDWKCSSCGIVCEQSGKPLYNYCSHCGAKMDEVKDGD